MRCEHRLCSQTRRDTNFAIPGYSLFCHDTTASGKNKVFSVCGHLCGQRRFCAAFCIGENPANAGVARLCGVSPYPVPDTDTALPNQALYQMSYTSVHLLLGYAAAHLCYFNISGRVCQAGDWAGNCGCSIRTYAYAKKNTTALAHAGAVVFFGG